MFMKTLAAVLVDGGGMLHIFENEARRSHGGGIYLTSSATSGLLGTRAYPSQTVPPP